MAPQSQLEESANDRGKPELDCGEAQDQTEIFQKQFANPLFSRFFRAFAVDSSIDLVQKPSAFFLAQANKQQTESGRSGGRLDPAFGP